MNKTLIAAAVAATTLVAAPALAQDVEGYVNLGYSHIDADGPDLGAATVRVGATMHTYLGVEVEASLGVVKDGPIGLEAELDQAGAVYAVGHFPIGDQFELMARAGWGRAQISAGGFTVTDSSWNYGVAGQYNFDETQGVRVDWTRHDFEDINLQADFYSVSYVRRF
jgi:outer membrane immunogenic protein